MTKVLTIVVLLFSLNLFAANTSKDVVTETREDSIMLPVEPVTVKLRSEGNQQYLTAKIDLEVTSKKSALELTEKKALLRSAIIRIISSKSLKDFSTAQGKESLKEQIITELNRYTSNGKIKYLYFTDFVIQ
jgi:flagellar protein FliL